MSESTCKVGGDAGSAVEGALPPGECSLLATSDPRVFGPHTWETLHTMSQNYPEKPNDITRAHCQNFVESLPYMLPCEHCGYHLKEFIAMNARHDGLSDDKCMGVAGESTCMSPENACQSKHALSNFFVRAHNNVSEQTHPCRKRFSDSDASQRYTRDFHCTSNIVWGDLELDRGV